MEQANGATGTMMTLALVVLAAALAILLAPLILSQSRGTKALTFFALLLTIAAAAAEALAFMGGVIGVAIGQAVANTLWLGALLCGIAACLDNTANERANDLAFRILLNDADKLHPPDKLKGKYQERRNQQGHAP